MAVISLAEPHGLAQGAHLATCSHTTATCAPVGLVSSFCGPGKTTRNANQEVWKPKTDYIERRDPCRLQRKAELCCHTAPTGW
jgi:hypothetical protein